MEILILAIPAIIVLGLIGVFLRIIGWGLGAFSLPGSAWKPKSTWDPGIRSAKEKNESELRFMLHKLELEKQQSEKI